MRTAATVLNIIQERGKRKLPLEDIYRQLYNPDLYLRAYAKLYPNKGAMTEGPTAETVDAMAMAKIHHIIDDLRCERYRWTPVRRVYIPKKKKGKLRPLGLVDGQEKWPFTKKSELACCKYFRWLIKCQQPYLSGVFYQWTRAR